MESPERGADAAAVLWRKECDATVLPVSASPARKTDSNSFDFMPLSYPVFIYRDAAAVERVLIGDASHHLRIDVVRGSVLDGPVRFRYRLTHESALPSRILTLRRLVVLQWRGRFPQQLFPREPRTARWIRALQVFDGKRIGATNREIAIALYGEKIVQADWQKGPNYLRSRLQRALRFGSILVEGGYRQFLR